MSDSSDELSKSQEDGYTGVAVTIFTFFCLLVPFVFIGLAISEESIETAQEQEKPPPPPPFVESITSAGLISHLRALEEIAVARNNTRALGTPGYLRSVEYVEQLLSSTTDYIVWRQTFDLQSTTVTATLSSLILGSETPSEYIDGQDYRPMTYTGGGNIVEEQVDGVKNEGCSPADFNEFQVGRVAVVSRGNCNFNVKVMNAMNAGAIAVLIFNDGAAPDRMGVVLGTLGETISPTLPVLGISRELGLHILDTPTIRITMEVIVEDKVVETYNVHAESPSGNPERVIVVGAHLDSVPAGPGINDNGSGAAAILEMALQLYRSDLCHNLKNKIRFSWYGAEEVGLKGSSYYVQDIMANDPDEFNHIWMMLNFDMLGSPNGMRGVYEGETASDEILWLSATIQHQFEAHFNHHGLSWVPTEFSGRSDYGPFMRNGIPAGGLFTGAEVQKTEELRSIFGGLVAAFDPCYHRFCDTALNINATMYEEMARAAANVTLQFAQADVGRDRRSNKRTTGNLSFDGSSTNLPDSLN